jgi:hypothetical protein
VVLLLPKGGQRDAARALLAKGITGKLTMLDGKTGKPRYTLDIERAARLTVKEGPLRFAPYESRPSRSQTGETNEFDRGDQEDAA